MASATVTARVKILESCRNEGSILKLMRREWGYADAPDPGYRQGSLWWAGFSKGEKTVYAWGESPGATIREAALKAVQEIE